MTRLTIRHETRYSYERPVSFGQHRLLIRPRDGHALRVLTASLAFSPPGETRWIYDAFGNCVCLLSPSGEADRLTIVSELIIERFPAPLSPLQVENPHTATPIVYDKTDRTVLAPFMEPVTEDADSVLLDWIRDDIARSDEPALDFLLRINQRIHEQFSYNTRFEEGCQDPAFTVMHGAGTCRDFAWLMVEALRRLGYAARFVTGYLHSPDAMVRGAGATHAWCEVFLPDLGWTEFDPTNGLAESSALIPVAISRTPEEATPISGAIMGNPGRSNLEIFVDVRIANSLQAAA